MFYKVYLITRSLISYLLILIILLLFFVPCLLLIAILPKDKRCDSSLIFRLLHICYSGVVYAVFLPIKITGKEHIPSSPAILIANHQSAFDIPIVGYLCNAHPHVWYVLDYYARKPILGFFVRRMGVSITQDSGVQAARSLLQGIKMVMECNRHTIIFPEGGRYIDGTIHPFLGGFALLAKKTQRPVVPIYIKNVDKIFPPKAYVIQEILPIEVIVGPLYDYQADETEEAFVARLHEWFKQHI